MANEMSGRFGTADAVKTFLFGGDAILTVVSQKTGVRFTYRVAQPDAKPGDTRVPPFFVKLLTGPDNLSNYSYLGMIGDDRREFRLTKASKGNDTTPSVVAFRYLLANLVGGALKGIEVYHEGRCGRCGRTLTVPESIESGFGPECREKLGIETDGPRPSAPVAPKAEPVSALNPQGMTMAEISATDLGAIDDDEAPRARIERRAGEKIKVFAKIPGRTFKKTTLAPVDFEAMVNPADCEHGNDPTFCGTCRVSEVA